MSHIIHVADYICIPHVSLMNRILSHTIRILLLLVAIVASRGLSLRAQTDAEQVLTIGRNVLSMNDYMLAIQYFNQAIKAKPYMSEPYYLRAFAKMSLDDYAGAEADCSLALERNKFHTETYKLRGFARQQLGLDSLAVEDYDIGLRYNPQDKWFLFYKGVAETQLRRDAEADSTFAKLLRLYPGFDDAYSARGRLRALEGDTVAALADISKAIDLSRTQLQPYLLRADLLVHQRKWEEALKDMDEAIKLKPHEADYYLNRAFIRYNMDDYFGAMADYNYTLELEPHNSAALFNRALLRYEVKDLDRAATDMQAVLAIDPDNFHARYNLGLVNLERGKYKEALQDFSVISKRYPRFHPAYYAQAEAMRLMGNMRGAMQLARQGDDLVRSYVKNPEKNPLDRPAIQSGTANSGSERHVDESEEDVMNRFNQLVTSGSVTETQLAFNDRIKGRVQDRDMTVEIEPAYMLSYVESAQSLKNTSNYFRELDDFNRNRYIAQRIYLTPAADVSADNYEALFNMADNYAGSIEGSNRAADWLALALARTQLKDPEAAIKAYDKAIELYPDFVMAYMGRAYARTLTDDVKQVSLAIADYDKALRLHPGLVYAWFNKGNIFYANGDYTTALQCYGEALRTDPSFAAALFNRGITYLRLGNKRQAFADLSKAGELGVLPSYNVLKRMK